MFVGAGLFGSPGESSSSVGSLQPAQQQRRLREAMTEILREVPEEAADERRAIEEMIQLATPSAVSRPAINMWVGRPGE